MQYKVCGAEQCNAVQCSAVQCSAECTVGRGAVRDCGVRLHIIASQQATIGQIRQHWQSSGTGECVSVAVSLLMTTLCLGQIQWAEIAVCSAVASSSCAGRSGEV